MTASYLRAGVFLKPILEYAKHFKVAMQTNRQTASYLPTGDDNLALVEDGCGSISRPVMSLSYLAPTNTMISRPSLHHARAFREHMLAAASPLHCVTLLFRGPKGRGQRQVMLVV